MLVAIAFYSNAQIVSTRCDDYVKIEPSLIKNLDHFIGGDSAFNKFISNNIDRNILSATKGKDIKVDVLVVTDTLGHLIRCQLFPQGADSAFADECIRLVKLIGQWLPCQGTDCPQVLKFIVRFNADSLPILRK